MVSIGCSCHDALRDPHLTRHSCRDRACGMTLFMMLHGRPAFMAPTLPEIYALITTAPLEWTATEGRTWSGGRDACHRSHFACRAVCRRHARGVEWPPLGARSCERPPRQGPRSTSFCRIRTSAPVLCAPTAARRVPAASRRRRSCRSTGISSPPHRRIGRGYSGGDRSDAHYAQCGRQRCPRTTATTKRC